MITEQELRDLINNGNELEWLDFKSEPYDISNSDRSVAEAQKTSFLKDVIAMANTPREKTAYIILGVKWYKDGTRDIQGIKKHFDDADLQPLLDSLKLNVRPQFVYQPMRLDDKVFGVVEIPIEKNMRGPYIPKQHRGSKIKKSTLYFRRGTTNQESDYDDRRQIEDWFDKLRKQTIESTTDEPKSTFWSEFSLACHNFDSARRYMLILGPDRSDLTLDWAQLAKLPLSTVLDFDPETEVNGVYYQVKDTMNRRRSLHLWTDGNVTSMVPEKACYWFAARGLIEQSIKHGA